MFDPVAKAFSRKALVYDAFGEDHPNLARMRQKVYDHVATLAAPGAHLLELNAGTGLDAVVYARHGYRVHATDIAPGMVREIERKIAALDLQERLTVQQCSFTALEQVSVGPFDAVVSNSGGLNCLGDLTAVTRHLPRLLRPGGTVTWVIMPRICPWELAVSIKDWRVGTRRLRRGGVLANVEGVQFMTYYFSTADVRHAFGPRFQQVALEGLSVVTPPADNKTFAHRHPRMYRWLTCIDDRLSRWPPFHGWGDFFILSMRYKGEANAPNECKP